MSHEVRTEALHDELHASSNTGGTPLECDTCDKKYAHFDPLKEANEFSQPEENATNAPRAVGKAAKGVIKIEEGEA